MDKTFEECLELAKRKGADYTKGSEDALANFKEGGTDLDLSPEKVLMVMFRKHWTAIINYVRTGGQSESEPIDERLKDLINYAVLLKALIHERRELEEAIARTQES